MDLSKKITTRTRVTHLKSMHQLMLNSNDEDIYGSWILRFPDCPMEEDFIDAALDDEEYNNLVDLFIKLISKPGWRW